MKPYWKYLFTDGISISTLILGPIVGTLGLLDRDPNQDPIIWWLWIIGNVLVNIGFYLYLFRSYKKNNP